MGEQGDQPGAARRRRTAYEIRKEITGKATANLGWQGKLASSEERMASILAQEGDNAAALAAYQKSLALYEDLARHEAQDNGLAARTGQDAGGGRPDGTRARELHRRSGIHRPGIADRRAIHATGPE